MNTTESLIVLDGWSITIPPTAEQARAGVIDLLDSLDLDGAIPTTELGQGIAQEIVGGLAQAKAWMASVEEMSKQLRQPYFDHAKKIKATSDTFLMPLAERIASLGAKLADYEAEKKRIEIHLEQQRQAEAARLRREEEERQRAAEVERERQERAERERLAALEAVASLIPTDSNRRSDAEAALQVERQKQAEAEAQRDARRQAEQQTLATIDTGGLRYDAPKTEGVQVKVAYEFEVTDKRALAEYCWQTGKAWVNDVTFFKRDIMAWLNSDGADRNIPGIRVFQSVGATVRKARTPKVINVATSRTEL